MSRNVSVRAERMCQWRDEREDVSVVSVVSVRVRTKSDVVVVSVHN